MFETLTIQSHKGPYTVEFENEASFSISPSEDQRHYIIDKRVAEIYQTELACILASKSVLTIEALERNKSLECMPEYVTYFLSRGIKRGHVLIAIGGGIIQDITCFLASVLLRGIEWRFFPTTLLAQADSCIGSKSSINVGPFKNIVGTYNPPKKVVINASILGSLPDVEIRSGIGEMLKVHIIAGPSAFERISSDYAKIAADPVLMLSYIKRSLEIKKNIIEQDEFDAGIRNKMNLGHTFGHAIESATNFGVPHGVAVTIGIDMANFMSVQFDRMHKEHFDRMHPTLKLNFCGYEVTDIPKEKFFAAISKDKKNTDSKLCLILPDAAAIPQRVECDNDEYFRESCSIYFDHIRLS